ncbi:DUF6804 family protein [Pontibacter korlensis]|uniref:DUF6804 family protein n=2 Tax=Pontibacter korlensis TaxID=400092 RepID=UPI000696269B|nr:DUF6804 family protein [Pontibacter korlensis]
MKLTLNNFKVIACLALLLGTLNLPIGYYLPLRIIVIGAAIGSLIKDYDNDSQEPFFTYAYIAIIIVFNPIFPLPFGKTIWVVIDIITCLILFLSLFNNTTKKTKISKKRRLSVQELNELAPFSKEEIEVAKYFETVCLVNNLPIYPIDYYSDEGRKALESSKEFFKIPPGTMDTLDKQEERHQRYRQILYWFKANEYGPPYTEDEINKALKWEKEDYEYSCMYEDTEGEPVWPPPIDKDPITGNSYLDIKMYLMKAGIIENYRILRVGINNRYIFIPVNKKNF